MPLLELWHHKTWPCIHVVWFLLDRWLSVALATALDRCPCLVDLVFYSFRIMECGFCKVCCCAFRGFGALWTRTWHFIHDPDYFSVFLTFSSSYLAATSLSKACSCVCVTNIGDFNTGDWTQDLLTKLHSQSFSDFWFWNRISLNCAGWAQISILLPQHHEVLRLHVCCYCAWQEKSWKSGDYFECRWE